MAAASHRCEAFLLPAAQDGHNLVVAVAPDAEAVERAAGGVFGALGMWELSVIAALRAASGERRAAGGGWGAAGAQEQRLAVPASVYTQSRQFCKRCRRRPESPRLTGVGRLASAGRARRPGPSGSCCVSL